MAVFFVVLLWCFFVVFLWWCGIDQPKSWHSISLAVQSMLEARCLNFPIDCLTLAGDTLPETNSEQKPLKKSHGTEK